MSLVRDGGWPELLLSARRGLNLAGVMSAGGQEALGHHGMGPGLVLDDNIGETRMDTAGAVIGASVCGAELGNMSGWRGLPT